jgi:hypothetical protein
MAAVASQMDGRNGDLTKSKLVLAFQMDLFLSNNDLIHSWITDQLDATLGRLLDPNSASTTVGIQGNLAVVQNMSGIIATEVGRGLGVAMQNASKGGPAQVGGTKQGRMQNPTPRIRMPPSLVSMGPRMSNTSRGVVSIQVGKNAKL